MLGLPHGLFQGLQRPLPRINAAGEAAAAAGAPPPGARYMPTFRGLHNPLDICTVIMATEDPSTLSLAALYARLPSGWTQAIMLQAVREWQSLGALELNEDTGRIVLRTILPMWLPPSAPTLPRSGLRSIPLPAATESDGWLSSPSSPAWAQTVLPWTGC